jgi:hypothetical protein
VFNAGNIRKLLIVMTGRFPTEIATNGKHVTTFQTVFEIFMTTLRNC